MCEMCVLWGGGQNVRTKSPTVRKRKKPHSPAYVDPIVHMYTYTHMYDLMYMHTQCGHNIALREGTKKESYLVMWKHRLNAGKNDTSCEGTQS